MLDNVNVMRPVLVCSIGVCSWVRGGVSNVKYASRYGEVVFENVSRNSSMLILLG